MASNQVTDWLRDNDFREFLDVLFDNSYYEILFPFILAYAVLFTILGKVKIFQNKEGKPIKSVIVIISAVVSFFGVSFETAPGYTVGKYLMMLFPNISALTMGLLGLYVAGSILGKDFFRGVLRKDHTAYLYFGIGVIGLGSVLYYMGIAMGFWDQYPISQESYWNMVIAIGLLIMGVVFLFIDMAAIGTVLLIVFGLFVYNYGNDGSILEYFVDPVIFIILIVVALLSWLNTDSEKKAILNKKISDGQNSMATLEKELGRKPKDYEARIYDIVTENLKENKGKLKKLK